MRKLKEQFHEFSKTQVIKYFTVEIKIEKKSYRVSLINMSSDFELKIILLDVLFFKVNSPNGRGFIVFNESDQLTDEFRQKMFDEITSLILCSKHNKEEHLEKIGKFQEDIKQEDIKQEYISKYNLTKDEFNTLHYFFSPNRVPRGLTREDISKCINSLSLRKQQMSGHCYSYPPLLTHGVGSDPEKNISRTQALNLAIREIIHTGLPLS